MVVCHRDILGICHIWNGIVHPVYHLRVQARSWDISSIAMVNCVHLVNYGTALPDGINPLQLRFPSHSNLKLHAHMAGWWFQPLWKIWKSVGMSIPNIWKNKRRSKPPNRWDFGGFQIFRPPHTNIIQTAVNCSPVIWVSNLLTQKIEQLARNA